jgi:hypothetical protein
MNIYYKIGIVISGFIILAGALWFFVFGFGSSGPDTSQPRNVNQILADLSGNDPNTFVRNTGTGITNNPNTNSDTKELKVDLIPLSSEQLAEAELEDFVARFIERWGTYSNQSDFSSLKSLDSQMSSKMRNFIDSYTDQIKQDYPYQNGYYGITTRSVAVDLGNFNSGLSFTEASIGTRRTETMGSAESSTFNQDVTVDLIKINNEWLVDGVFWVE